MKKSFVTAMYVLLYASALLMPALVVLGDNNRLNEGLFLRLYGFFDSTEDIWRYFYSIAITAATFRLVKKGATFSQAASILTIIVIGFFLAMGLGNIFILSYFAFIAGSTNKLWKLFDKQQKANELLFKEFETLTYKNQELTNQINSMNAYQLVMPGLEDKG